jgi:hypothetical protein
MPTHKPLPANGATVPDLQTARRTQVEQARVASVIAYKANPFHRLDPRFTAPGVFHAYQIGEAPGQFGEDVSLNFGIYNVDMIRRYPSLSPTEQLRVRWAVAAKPSWTYEELLDYRVAAFGLKRRPGDNPYADLEPYDVRMIERYPWMSSAQQLKVRYSVAMKESWTPEELAAYRRAAFSAMPFQRTFATVGPFRRGAVGEMPQAFDKPEFPHGQYTPGQAAQAFQRLGQAMEGLTGQARRAAGAMQQVRTKMPLDLPADPSHDVSALGGWGIPDDKRINL